MTDALAEKISAERKILADFAVLLKKEEKALVDGDTDALDKLAPFKSEMLQNLSALSRERGKLLAALGLSADRTGMESWLKGHSQCGKLWQEILQLANEVKQINQTNGALIDLRLRHSQQSITALQAIVNSTSSLYGPDGQSSLDPGSRRGFSA